MLYKHNTSNTIYYINFTEALFRHLHSGSRNSRIIFSNTCSRQFEKRTKKIFILFRFYMPNRS